MLVSAIAMSLLVGGGIPERPTAAADLSTEALRHHEILRIDRDFGMAKWELALDSWLPAEGDRTIADIRLWWVNVEDADRRKPLSAHLRRYIALDSRRRGAAKLDVRMAGDDKEYTFTVELDGAERPVVRVTVELEDGRRVERCRCERARLIARRVVGMPVGIEGLRVQCTDDAGVKHDGAVVYRATDDGAAYEPD